MVSSIGNDSGSVAQVLQQQRQQIETQKVDEQQKQKAQEASRQEQIKTQETVKAEQQQNAVDERRGRTVDINV